MCDTANKRESHAMCDAANELSRMLCVTLQTNSRMLCVTLQTHGVASYV